MNDQQRAAMQMALEALKEALLWIDPERYDTNRTLSAITALREALPQPQDHSEQHLNMVQGEWVDLTSKEINEVWCRGINYEAAINAVIAKFKEKNTPPVVPDGYALIGIDALKAWGKYEEVSNACCHPIHKPVVPQGEPVAYGCFANGKLYSEALLKPSGAFQIPLYTKPVVKQSLTTQAPVVPQGEPVAWIHTFMGVDQVNTTPPEIYGKDWTHQPLYTTPPSVEAAIEATKEKAAKVCEELVIENNGKTARNKTSFECAAAIRSMK